MTAAKCIEEDKKFFRRFSPGCGGKVEWPSGLLEADRKHPETLIMKEVKGKSCRLHYLENAFGLVALECPECKKQDKDTLRDQIQTKTDVAMEDTEKYTYIPMELALASARHTWYLRKTDIPAFTVRCWNCSYVFWKGRKATKAEREKNERQAIKEIPEANPKMFKFLKKSKLVKLE